MSFSIVKTGKPAICQKCEKTISGKEFKLLFTKGSGLYKISKSLCLPCLGRILGEKGIYLSFN